MGEHVIHREFVPTEEMIGKVIDSAADANLEDLRDYILMVAQTGMHITEFQNVRHRDIDLDHGHVFIGGKSNSHGGRTIPLSPSALLAIKGFCARRPGQEFVLGHSPRSVTLRVRRELRAVCARLNIRPFTFHSLRSSFIHRLANSGVDLETLSSLLGYKGYWKGH